ncbi:MAG: flagellar hook-length control protein FliK [Tissierellia bacterium]|nr:flagellar hook-length control protein FliK [Tissierellia bacterium]
MKILQNVAIGQDLPPIVRNIKLGNNFATLLQNATENLTGKLLEDSSLIAGDLTVSNLLATEDTEDIEDIIEESFEDIENPQENYENLKNLANFFYRPTSLPVEIINEEIASEGVSIKGRPVEGIVAKEYEMLSEVPTENLLPQAKQETQLLKQRLFADHKAMGKQVAVKEEKQVAFEKLRTLESLKAQVEKFQVEKTQVEKAEEKPEVEVEIGTLAKLPFGENRITISDESNKIQSQVLTQVKDKIVIMVEQSEGSEIKTVTMQLQPESLGKVSIKMVFENNKLSVEIEAQKEESQKIISSSVGELKEMLGKRSEEVTVLVKTYGQEERQVQNNWNSQQIAENFYQGDNLDHGRGRQQNNYYKGPKEKKETFSDLINLNNKIEEGNFEYQSL